MTLPEIINKDAGKKMVHLAQQIVNEEVKSDIEIARNSCEINRLRAQLDIPWEDEPYIIFFRVEDDLDGLPLDQDVRKRWDENALKKLDEELKEKIAFYKKDILRACQSILNQYK